MSLLSLFEGYRGKSTAKTRISYEFIKQRVEEWMLCRNGKEGFPVLGHLCYCDISVFSVQKPSASAKQNNFSFSFTLSRKDDGEEYNKKLEEFLNNGKTIGRHPEFQRGLPIMGDDGRYDLGYLFEEVVHRKIPTIRNPVERFSSKSIDLKVVDTQETVDNLDIKYKDSGLKVEKVFHEYIEECCKGFSDLSGRPIKYVIGIPICKPPYKADPRNNVCWAAIFIGLSSLEDKGKIGDVVRQMVLDIKNLFSSEIIPEFITSDELQGTRDRQRFIANEFAKTGNLNSLYKIFLDAFEYETILRGFKENICFFDFNIKVNEEAKGVVIVPGTKVVPNDASEEQKKYHWFDQESTPKPGFSDSLYLTRLSSFIGNKQTIGGCTKFLKGLIDYDAAILMKQQPNVRYIHQEVVAENNSGGKAVPTDCLVAHPLEGGVDLQNEEVSRKPNVDDIEKNQEIFIDQVAKGICDMMGRPCSYYIAVPFMEHDRNVAQLFVGLSDSYFKDSEREERELFLGAVNDIVAILRGFIITEESSRKDERDKLKEAYTKAAIGSIMSRNGSHNIGSHVLSALSHNVGTMPDDRVLYQYIQQRMDYIATVTTDFPAWSQPTMLISGLMKEFMSQRHLLEHIAESEGLSAWEFQNVNMPKALSRGQKRRIQIHIRRVDVDGFKDVIEYGNNGEIVHLDWDVPLAIPGGVVGNHAFFTILENVIRNSAKHGWSTTSDNVRSEKNLEVFLDYCDQGEVVEFSISDNMSIVENKESLQYDKKKGKHTHGVKIVDEREKDLPLHWMLQLKLAKGFVVNGRLRKEDWGLAEMKISAGYLMSRTIRDIGGLDCASNDYTDDAHSILLPCAVNNDTGIHLGYKFKVKKPREVVFVLDEKVESHKALLDLLESKRIDTDKNQNELLQVALNNLGFVFRSLSKVIQDKTRNKFGANYVVLPCLGMEHKKEMLPFRVLVWGKENVKYREDLVGILSIDEIYRVLDSCRDLVDVQTRLYRCVSEAWLMHLRESLYRDNQGGEEKEAQKLELYVNTRGDDANGGRGLITDSDLLRFVFQNCFRTAIETFIRTCERSGHMDPETKLVLTALHAMPLVDGDSREQTAGVLIDFAALNTFPVECMIAWQLISFLDELTIYKGEYVERLKQSMVKFYGESQKMSQGDFAIVKDYLRFSYCVAPKMEYMLRHYQGMDIDEIGTRCYKYAEKHPNQIGDFVNHLADVFRQTDVFLRKYEERIVTLPAGFSRQENGNGKTVPHTAQDWWPKFVNYHLNESLQKGEEGCNRIIYYRHYKPGENNPNDGTIYREPLSGTQSYLNALVRLVEGEQCHQNDILITKLIENAFLKVCVADERVAKFLRDHGTVRNTYAAENIHVIDEKYVENMLQPQHAQVDFGNNNSGLYRPDNMQLLLEIRRFVVDLEQQAPQNDEIDEDACDNWINEHVKIWCKLHEDIGTVRKDIPKKFDILIIHQGLIDKWLGNAHHSKCCVGVFLEILKEYIKYVVITTGRGTPANIPSTARVLPFSTIESTLFKMYPEKLVLVDTVMNILPIGKSNSQGGKQ